MGLITDIESIASHTTERKNPGVDNTENKMFVPQEVLQQQAEEKAEARTTAANPQPAVKITPDKAKQTGRTNAYLVTSITEMIRGGILLYKQHNCLTDNEKDILELAHSKSEASLTDVERSVIYKYSRASAKFEKKREKIATPDEDMKMLSEGFETYAMVTGKESSPTLIIGAVLTRYVSKIAIEALLD